MHTFESSRKEERAERPEFASYADSTLNFVFLLVVFLLSSSWMAMDNNFQSWRVLSFEFYTVGVFSSLLFLSLSTTCLPPCSFLAFEAEASQLMSKLPSYFFLFTCLSISRENSCRFLSNKSKGSNKTVEKEREREVECFGREIYVCAVLILYS